MLVADLMKMIVDDIQHEQLHLIQSTIPLRKEAPHSVSFCRIQKILCLKRGKKAYLISRSGWFTMVQNRMLSRPTAFSVLFVIGLAAISLADFGANAFQSMHLMPTPTHETVDAGRIVRKNRGQFRPGKHNSLLCASPSDEESESVQRLFEYENSNFESEIGDEELEEIEMGQPPEWMVMQQVNRYCFDLC